MRKVRKGTCCDELAIWIFPFILFCIAFIAFIVWDSVQWHKAGKPANWQEYKIEQRTAERKK